MERNVKALKWTKVYTQKPLLAMCENPRLSLRNLVANLNNGKIIATKTLQRTEYYYPFKIQLVQELSDGDFDYLCMGRD